tara:strand:+ start:157 stop:1119 length:963 start_codon:yes stop_codon:yes gene_type:complete
MLKKLRKMVAKALPGDSEKYLGTVLALATGNPLFAGIGALADPDAGFGEIAQAAFLANASPGLKFGKFDMTGGNKLFGDGKFMSALQGGGKTGAGSFGEFFLGKKGSPLEVQGKKLGFETPTSLTSAGGTAGLFGSGGSFIPKNADGSVDASKLLSRLAGASAVTGAAFSPFGLFDTPKQEEDQFDGKFPGSDYQAKSFNLTPGQLLDLKLGGGIAGDYYDMQGNLVQNAAQGGYMQEPTNGLKEIEDVMMMAEGGTSEFPRKTGEISGPGTGTSDSIPAMLSDGEFVMTANAVKGAGDGDRMKGARKMYQMMDQLEGKA